MTRMARIGLLSLDTLTNAFTKATFIVKFRMCEYDMKTCEKHMTYALENGETKRTMNLPLQPLMNE